MPSASKFNNFVHALNTGALDMATDTINVMLSNTAPVATNSLYADISGNEISSGNGYTTGGTTFTGTGSTNTSGTETVSASAVTFTASGGTIGPFRYFIIYDVTNSDQPLIAWYDYGSAITLSSGDTITITPTGSVLYTLA